LPSQIGIDAVQVLASSTEHPGEFSKRGGLNVEVRHCRSPMKFVVRRKAVLIVS
jgi:hypothetical protein